MKNSVKIIVLDHQIHDPLVPILKEDALDALSTQLYPLWKYCESRNINVLSELHGAPEATLQLLKDPKLVAEILRYIQDRRCVATQAD